MKFQSTHPVWGATPTSELSDFLGCYFNPRTPCGVRPDADAAKDWLRVFQSTHPVWGATAQPASLFLQWSYFNPRTPCGVRRTQTHCAAAQ